MWLLRPVACRQPGTGAFVPTPACRRRAGHGEQSRTGHLAALRAVAGSNRLGVIATILGAFLTRIVALVRGVKGRSGAARRHSLVVSNAPIRTSSQNSAATS